MKKYLLPENGNFYKANLHCHTNVSDGKLSPEDVKKYYMEHGYSIVAYTDHDVFIPHNDLTEENFLALNGYEMEMNEFEDPFWLTKTCHLCLVALEPDNFKQVCFSGTNYMFGNSPKYADKVEVDEETANFVRSHTPECINEIISEGRKKGFFVTYNHPGWSLEDYSDYISYENMNAMEICNFGAYNGGFGDYNPRVYDDMLRAGKRIFCIAGDDNHGLHDAFGGFTVIKADNLDYRTITKALEDGNFYASQGPEIKELWYEDGKLHIKCSPAARVEISSGIRWAHLAIGNENEPLEYVSCGIEGLPEHTYVRVTVTDFSGKHANSNAYFMDELTKE